MSHFYFKGSKEELDAIIKDPTIKKITLEKIRWDDYLLLGFKYAETNEHESYVMLKYGELLVEKSHLIPDRSPVMFVDYMPKDVPDAKVLAKRRINK